MTLWLLAWLDDEYPTKYSIMFGLAAPRGLSAKMLRMFPICILHVRCVLGCVWVYAKKIITDCKLDLWKEIANGTFFVVLTFFLVSAKKLRYVISLCEKMQRKSIIAIAGTVLSLIMKFIVEAGRQCCWWWKSLQLL